MERDGESIGTTGLLPGSLTNHLYGAIRVRTRSDDLRLGVHSPRIVRVNHIPRAVDAERLPKDTGDHSSSETHIVS